jgi:hypothetical protein
LFDPRWNHLTAALLSALFFFLLHQSLLGLARLGASHFTPKGVAYIFLYALYTQKAIVPCRNTPVSLTQLAPKHNAFSPPGSLGLACVLLFSPPPTQQTAHKNCYLQTLTAQKEKSVPD